MKKISLVFATMMFAGAASAGDFTDQPGYASNPDLYGGDSGSTMALTAVQPGIGDGYGGSLFENNSLEGLVQGSGRIQSGSNEAYGSSIPNVEAGDLDW